MEDLGQTSVDIFPLSLPISDTRHEDDSFLFMFDIMSDVR